MTELRTVAVAGLTLALPEGHVARVLGRPDDTAAVESFLAASPDATLHHQPAWLEFDRSINRRVDLLVVERDGAPLVGIPIRPEGRTLMVGYSGALFPPGDREASLKRGVRALVAVAQANPRLGLQGAQSLQAPAYDDVSRTARLAWLIEQEGLAGPSQWSRLLTWSPDRPVPGIDDDPLDHLGEYDAKLRSQIRQAARHGLTVDHVLPTDASQASVVYADFTDLHRESWGRTGLRPHRDAYWVGLSQAVLRSGGQDLVVLARSPEGELVAAATCHLWGRRAIYWAGASLPSGLAAGGNPLCLHVAITRCRALGVTTFELGRFSATETGEKEQSITRYKAQFGGQVTRLTTLATRGGRVESAAHQAYRVGRKLRVWRGGEHFYG